jgi:AhpD family alkylhydroperoxidase
MAARKSEPTLNPLRHLDCLTSRNFQMAISTAITTRGLLCVNRIGGLMHYHDSDDLKLLGEFKKLAPAEFAGFVELDKTVGRNDGAIPRKYRELIAIAVACTTQCPYCLDVHTRNAKFAGATREEVIEASMLAAALRAGAAVTHGALALKLFDKVPEPPK